VGANAHSFFSEEKTMKKRYWMGHIGQTDDFGNTIQDEFVDGKTRMGPWGIMTPTAWRAHGVGRFGTGFGQRYQKQDDGRWLKVEG
jgi:hypothetical protein